MISGSDIHTIVAAISRRPTFALVGDDVPSPWEGSVQDVNWLMRPFLAHAELKSLDVYIELYDDDVRLSGFGAMSRGRPPHEPSVWFSEVTNNLCVLGMRDGATHDLSLVQADLAHAAASVALSERGLLPDDDRFRARAADLAAVRLGFALQLRARPGAMSVDEINDATERVTLVPA